MKGETNALQSEYENDLTWGYNAEEYNPVVELQYLRARYYVPETGAFITMDSLIGTPDNLNSQNRYAYAENDPLNNYDPSGHSAASQNANGIGQYTNSGALNELRDFMTSAGLWAGEVTANNAFNQSVVNAQNTSYMNYQSISGISQSTANYYIQNGILTAGQVSKNYGCASGYVNNEAVEKFTDNVNAAKDTANKKIADIKANKKKQYDDYQAYLRRLAQQRASSGSGGTNGMSVAQQSAYIALIVSILASLYTSSQMQTILVNMGGSSSSGGTYTYDNVKNLTGKSLVSYFDGIARQMAKKARSLIGGSFTTGQITLPMGGGSTAYYKSMASSNGVFNMNTILQNHLVKFESFSASFGFSSISFNPTGVGVRYSASGTKGNTTGKISANYNTGANTTAIEYSISQKLSTNVSIASILGVSQTGSKPNTPSTQPEYALAKEVLPWVLYLLDPVLFPNPKLQQDKGSNVYDFPAIPDTGDSTWKYLKGRLKDILDQFR